MSTKNLQCAASRIAWSESNGNSSAPRARWRGRVIRWLGEISDRVAAHALDHRLAEHHMLNGVGVVRDVILADHIPWNDRFLMVDQRPIAARPQSDGAIRACAKGAGRNADRTAPHKTLPFSEKCWLRFVDELRTRLMSPRSEVCQTLQILRGMTEMFGPLSQGENPSRPGP
ncbi:hypothetical protein [Rhodopseudomonas pseudopalustris]|uniref:hypothetical protein n=1 Tax=Rhodopseudomonas pseudopalustris TaxID=1513892 RepID=UPI0011145779|nr:hypothetical protein [Rhodopseudomonas pseudopalustris]